MGTTKTNSPSGGGSLIDATVFNDLVPHLFLLLEVSLEERIPHLRARTSQVLRRLRSYQRNRL
jgi:hypothetical protein